MHSKEIPRPTGTLPIIAEHPAEARELLGTVRYGAEGGPPRWEHDRPVLPLHMTGAGDREVVESWPAMGPVRTGEHRGLLFAHDGAVLFAAGHIGPSRTCRDDAERAYRAAFELVEALEYPHVFRMWNTIAGITDRTAAGTEVYADFCAGRAQAFENAGRVDMAAATGIGALGGGASFYFLAHRSRTTVHLENPLQTPSSEYPARYGPRPPRFARATYLAPGRDGERGRVYVSGTASILDHRTVHSGEVAAQTQVTLANIAVLIGAENLTRHGIDERFGLEDLRAVKVYVKRREDLPVVAELCGESFGARTDIAYFVVDVCRRDLLVEIEGITS
ncbi:FkbO/Hyg5 family chorismatase [Actinophytocola oryzae]|uniref:Chorismatase n=1 Tax=Actinophytocola oryzae TaxID=502181 RepID=A0A4R7W5R4_9PSEU|nr:FkbO/Hyg5 family chorismatase [Actinophytocola oryzae]TDV57932.1 chorismatase [Actinophytocola oryzae]